MSNNATKDAPSQEPRINEKKWSRELLAGGWTAIPNIIVERQRVLGLDAIDINILMHLACYWWTADNKPHPAKGTIAEAMNIHPRTVQRRIAEMEKGGLIRREERRIQGKGSKGSSTNIYHFDGLIKAAVPYAAEKVQEIEARNAARKARASRKGRPQLRLVKEEE